MINQKFAKSVTQAAFHLTLSRNMIAALAMIGNQDTTAWSQERKFYFPGYDGFTSSFRAIERRGLAEHNPKLKKPLNDSLGDDVWIYRLTPAGKNVLELLIMSGLVKEKETV